MLYPELYKAYGNFNPLLQIYNQKKIMSIFVRKYKLELLKCYNFNFDVGYDISHIFLDKELLQLEVEHIYRYMVNKVFGKPNPNEFDRPTKGRLASLNFAKK